MCISIIIISDVVDVVKNLHISHIEIRNIDSPDVFNFVHRTNIKTEVVQLDSNLEKCRKQLLNILRPYVDNLNKENVINGTTETLSKNWLIMQHNKFREKSKNHPAYKQINSNFAICISLYHGLELLVRNGFNAFFNFLKENNICHQRDVKLNAFLDEVKNIIKHNGTDYFGHPKFEILKNQLIKHMEKNKDSRAIVFCEYRFCVSLILKMLQTAQTIRAKILVGQNNSTKYEKTTQKEQQKIINDFKDGICNVLISTSVGEEGLDIGEVDLIICFDIYTKNSSRFVQRIGRTGRKRDGTAIMLVTPGKENENLKEALKTQNRTNNQIVNNIDVNNSLFVNSYRLVPIEFTPECLETHMNPMKSKQTKLAKPKTLKDFFDEVSPNKENEMIVISDDDEENIEPNSPTICNKENDYEKINLFAQRLNQNKFYSSICKEKKEKGPTNYTALIDVTNLVRDIVKLKKDVNLLKGEEVKIEKEKTFSNYPEDDDDFSYRFSQNLSTIYTSPIDKMQITKLSKWSSPTGSDRFDLNVNNVDDLFEGSWKSEGSLGNLENWKNSSSLQTNGNYIM